MDGLIEKGWIGVITLALPATLDATLAIRVSLVTLRRRGWRSCLRMDGFDQDGAYSDLPPSAGDAALGLSWNSHHERDGQRKDFLN